jgi:hypothetical protein
LEPFLKKATVTLTLLLIVSILANGQEKSAKTGMVAPAGSIPAVAKGDAAKPITALGWLVSGVWSTDASQLGPGMLRIETRYQWADNQAFLRFNTHFVMKDGVFKNYDGHFFWNPAESELAIWYMDARNNITQGPIKMDGDNFQVTFRGRNFQDQPADLRVTVTRQNQDRYTWLLEESAAPLWKQMAKLAYVRQAIE